MVGEILTSISDVLGRKTIHPFPARMAPMIALEALGESREPLRILDPMVGSGTVVAVAQASGHNALGFDTDPLAALLARVWTTPIDRDVLLEKAAIVLKRAQKTFADLALREAYPKDADDESRKFIRYWFDGRARRELASLSISIGRIQNEQIRDVLWCAFSRLIITKQAGASRAMDLSHSRPHRVFPRAQVLPFDGFARAAAIVIENCPHVSTEVGPTPTIRVGDARLLPVDSDSIDVVITSPPYLNAIDYMRSSKFSLIWMGHSVSGVRAIRSNIVGTEVSMSAGLRTLEVRNAVDGMGDLSELSSRNQGILERYLHDMNLVMKEISRVVRPGGRAVFVIGDSSLRGTFIRNSIALRILGEQAGLEFTEQSTRELPPNRRYLPPPSSGKAGSSFQTRMRREVVLTFRAK